MGIPRSELGFGLSKFAVDCAYAAVDRAADNEVEVTVYDKAGGSDSDTADSIELDADVSVTYTYDDKGCLSGDGTLTYSYDRENRLVEAEEGANTIAEYAYDVLGRRVLKAVGSTVTRFIYDGDNVVEEYEWDDVQSEWDLVAQYVHGPGIDNGNASRCLDEASLRRVSRVSGDERGFSGTVERWYYLHDGNARLREGAALLGRSSASSCKPSGRRPRLSHRAPRRRRRPRPGLRIRRLGHAHPLRPGPHVPEPLPLHGPPLGPRQGFALLGTKPPASSCKPRPSAATTTAPATTRPPSAASSSPIPSAPSTARTFTPTSAMVHWRSSIRGVQSRRSSKPSWPSA